PRTSPTSCSACGRSPPRSSADAEAERQAAVPSPRIGGYDPQAVGAAPERAGIEPQTHRHDPGLPAIRLHDVEAAALEARSEPASLAENDDPRPVRAGHRRR